MNKQRFNPNNPLDRHSGEGRNPVIKNMPQSGQNPDVVPLTWEFINHLDTGLRRYDAGFANGQSGFKSVWNAIDDTPGDAANMKRAPT